MVDDAGSLTTVDDTEDVINEDDNPDDLAHYIVEPKPPVVGAIVLAACGMVFRLRGVPAVSRDECCARCLAWAAENDVDNARPY